MIVNTNPPKDHATTLNPRLIARQSAIERRNRRNTKASFVESSPVARGLFLVLSTCLSMSASARSLITQPADLITTTPIIKVTKILASGKPLDANQRADIVGHRSKSMPIGLSNRANLSKLLILFI